MPEALSTSEDSRRLYHRFVRFGLSAIAIVVAIRVAIPVCHAAYRAYWRDRHTAVSLLLMDSRPVRLLSEEQVQFDPAEFESFRQTQAALLKSRVVLDRIVRLPKVAASIHGNTADQLRFLEKRLKVSWSRDEELVEVSLRGKYSDPTKLLTILDAIVQEYLDVELRNEDSQLHRQSAIVDLQYELKSECAFRLIQRIENLRKAGAESAAELQFAQIELSCVEETLSKLLMEKTRLAVRLQSPSRVHLQRRAVLKR